MYHQHCALFRRQRDEEGRRVVVVIKKNSTIRVEMQVSRRRNSQVPGAADQLMVVTKSLS